MQFRDHQHHDCVDHGLQRVGAALEHARDTDDHNDRSPDVGLGGLRGHVASDRTTQRDVVVHGTGAVQLAVLLAFTSAFGMDGSDTFEPGTTPLPDTMKIDWVRVWQYLR